MFERNRIDNASKESAAIELTLADESVLSGRFLIGMTRSLSDELNAPGGFIEFESHDGQRIYLAKGSIRTVRTLEIPRTDMLQRRMRNGDVFDPHAVLGVPANADKDAIRAAYHTLAKVYHPDRIQGFALPAEVVEYTTAMAKRINAAYSTLMTAAQAQAAKAARAPQRAAFGQ